ncbi:autotransporter outer membrane beta-barrel domain-containing protein [Methylovorus sp. MP688]|uniref:autotransporter family protein n=1 Tax=Methylovorus sp. (strain MP688) TaxID=887061 RepID=UPI0001EC4CF5|nr:autotransporter outer membrane beta-barrel domain-containing protein [Methylovorus sp. MP688]ADQ85155.1 outer membrane autotransporter barrel domain protein [Methylovorus sp. MP688]
MQNNHDRGVKRKGIALAVAMALPMMVLGNQAFAGCTTGSAPSTDANNVTCTDGSRYNNAAGSSLSNTATISTTGTTTSVVQMAGNGNTFVNAGTLVNDSVYTNTTANASQKYGVYIGSGSATGDEVNRITNSGTISATISDANMLTNKTRLNTAAVVGVGTDVEGEYTLKNSGTITATHNGVGRVNGVEVGGDVESMVITNSGTIAGVQSHAITKTTSTATSFQGTVTLSDSSTTSAANIGVAAGIYSEEEAASVTINNTGTISGTGTYASGIYTRAAESVINNDGVISGTAIGVAHVSDSGEVRSMTLNNGGTINGDILSVNGAALRWWSLSNGEATGSATIDSRLNINSQWGQADSAITNSGTINGNLYYSNGTHTLVNTGTLSGNIDLDQRDTTCSSCNTSSAGENTVGGTAGVSSNWTVVGTKQFTFENAGDFDGDLVIHTASSSASGSLVESSITLIPTILGSGAGSSLLNPSGNIAGMGDTLNIVTTAGGDESDITLAPKVASGVVVKNGEFFTVANTYQINGSTVSAGATTLPEVSSSNSLINWTAEVNANGSLVLESSTSTSGITGISQGARSALNNLLTFDSTLGSQVQNLEGDAAVQKAAEQLKPEANNAGYQAVVSATDKVFGLIGQHLENLNIAQLGGKSGVATGEQATSSGIWFQTFGFRGDQDKRKGVDGYDADAFGFAAGADTLVGDGNTRVGAAISYGNSDVSGKGVTSSNRLDIDSYQATLYGTRLMDGWYLNGAVGLGRHEYDSRRVIINNTVSGSHEAWQYTAKVDAGKPISIGKSSLIPVASLAYSRLDENGYTEHGEGALRISGRDTDSLRSGLGVKAVVPLEIGSLKSGIELRALWQHEFANTDQDTTARFAAGGSTFRTSAVSQERDSANLGISYRIVGNNTLKQSLLLSYDAEIRNQYLGQTALLQARFDF